jgi:hypothetical protein
MRKRRGYKSKILGINKIRNPQSAIRNPDDYGETCA